MATICSFASLVQRINLVGAAHLRVISSALLLWALFLSVGLAYGQQASTSPTATTRQGGDARPAVKVSHGNPEELRKSFPEVLVSDQDGRRVHFYSDLIKGRVVVVSFIYSTCTSTCPMQAQLFSQLQKRLGERLGKDVHLISITMDPLNDTPERLKAWGAKFKARHGWTLVTGEKTEMERLLLALKGDASGRGMHTPIVLIYNDSDGAWARTSGLTSPEEVIELIDGVMRGPVASLPSQE
jgi:protein SCO1/2